MANFIDTLIYHDQQYRNAPETYTYNADSFIVDTLYNFILDRGFPAYAITGPVSFQGDVPIDPTPLYIILWHTRGDSTALHHELYKAVIEGYYTPAEYAFLMDHRKLEYYQLYNDPLAELSPEQIEAANEKRSAINLESLEMHLAKIKFQKSQSDFYLYNRILFAFMGSKGYSKKNFAKMKKHSQK